MLTDLSRRVSSPTTPIMLSAPLLPNALSRRVSCFFWVPHRAECHAPLHPIKSSAPSCWVSCPITPYHVVCPIVLSVMPHHTLSCRLPHRAECNASSHPITSSAPSCWVSCPFTPYHVECPSCWVTNPFTPIMLSVMPPSGADAGLEVRRGRNLRQVDESPVQKIFFLTRTLAYVTFSAFSEEESGFVLRGFIAFNKRE